MAKSLLIINGSASSNSSNERLIERIVERLTPAFEATIYNNLKSLPHFDPVVSGSDNVPEPIAELRNLIQNSDAIIICTPEYIFSIPSGLKNVIEWCVSTTVFSDKPIGLITASAHGAKAQEELKLIMKTVMTKFTDDTTWLIQGIKGKINESGEIIHEQTRRELDAFVEAFKKLVG